MPTGELSLPHDIHGFRDYPFLWWPWALLAAVIVAGGLAWWFWRRKRQTLNAGLSLSRLEVAMRELKALQPAPIFDAAEQRRFCFQLSFLWRQVIELTLDIPATDLTLRELEQHLGKMPLVAEEGQRVLQVLKRTDMVKFADSVMERAEAEAVRDVCLQAIAHVIAALEEAKAATASAASKVKA